MSRTDFFELDRPEYIVSPELYQVVLAWDIVGKKPVEDKSIGYVFRRDLVTTDPKKVKIRRMSPLDKPYEEKKRLYNHIIPENSNNYGNRQVIGDAIFSSIEGIKSSKSVSQCSVPINSYSSLLQDIRGVTGKDRPANLSKIINTMFDLGGEPYDYTASELWWKNITSDESQEWLQWIENSLSAENINNDFSLKKLISECDDKSLYQNIGCPLWMASINEGTPFSWFREAWTRLCSDEWYRGLPRRRWNDWASCVLRTAVGLGYLWEMHFYTRLVEGLVIDGANPVDIVRNATTTSVGLLSWSTESTISSRDVSSYIIQITNQGTSARNMINSLVKEDIFPSMNEEKYTSSDNGLVEWVQDCSNHISKEIKKRLSETKGKGKVSGAKNTGETIRYALLCRDPFGINADYYGLLNKRGSRYTVVEPSSEWIVVISSLLSRKPNETVRMEDVVRSLISLGLKPDYNTLVHELEKAGLTRRSHDADEALEIATGF